MDDKRVFIVAELSANHNGSLKNALDTIKAAKEAGADAIKLQTYTADTITLDCDNDYFKIKQGTLWDGKRLYDLYKEAYTPWEWHKELFSCAKSLGLICFSTPFDFSAVDFLEELNNPIYKVASFEITDIPLIRYIAKKQKPIIISSGIAELADIELAIKTCYDAGNDDVTLLKCTSSYPTPLKEANLITIPDMAKRFGVKVGLSDHTLGITAPIVAVSLGAKVVEKHFILDRRMGGVDASFSLEPQEFKAMTKAIREAESLLGCVSYELSPKVKSSRELSRSLFVVEDIAEGEELTSANIRSIRPGFGLHPKYYDEVLGKRATKSIKRGTPLEFGMFE